MSTSILGKFERNAAVHLAQAISMEQDQRQKTLPLTRERTPFEIMKEALARLDIDTTDAMVSRYVDYWVRDAQTVIEFVAELRK